MTPPDDNGRLRNIEEWIRTLNEKADRILSRLDTKADTTRVEKLEARTQHLEVKQAGIAGAMTAVGLWIKSTFLSG